MKLLLGLGNPGPKYAATRHNTGFRIAECFAARWGIELEPVPWDARFGRGPVASEDGPVLDVGVLLPETFMNLSGDAVAAALRALHEPPSPGELLVLFDDVDLPFGRLRLRPGGGPGGHRGVEHLIERLGHGDFPRLRFGVGRPPEGMETSDYVLTPFTPEQERALGGCLARAVDAIEAFLFEGVSAAMNRFNPPPTAPDAVLEGGGPSR